MKPRPLKIQVNQVFDDDGKYYIKEEADSIHEETVKQLERIQKQNSILRWELKRISDKYKTMTVAELMVENPNLRCYVKRLDLLVDGLLMDKIQKL